MGRIRLQGTCTMNREGVLGIPGFSCVNCVGSEGLVRVFFSNRTVLFAFQDRNLQAVNSNREPHTWAGGAYAEPGCPHPQDAQRGCQQDTF